MRPSKKAEILEAAVELIERGSLEAVSYEALGKLRGCRNLALSTLPVTVRNHAWYPPAFGG